MCDLIQGCLDSNYFIYEEQLYKQTEGLAMGSSLSPVIANLYMEDFEETALETSLLKPKCWLRYVDDVFAVWSHGEVKLCEFLEHINSIHPKIQFTMEMEENGKLPFLDVLLIKKPNDSIGHTVYRKPTHTNRYLHADSHHFPGQKKGVLNTLITRSRRLADKEHIAEELRLLREVFLNNGFNKREIRKAFAN